MATFTSTGLVGGVNGVQDIHDNQVVDGRDDIIVVPTGGPYSWDTPLTITKGCILQGNTTVTGDCLDLANYPNGFVVGSNSIVQDDCVTGDFVIQVNLNATQHFEIRGLTFIAGIGHGNNYYKLIHLTTVPTQDVVNNNVRIHHNYFNAVKRRLVIITGMNYGVFDHNQVENTPTNPAVAYWPSGAGGSNGNLQWADYPWFGTDKFWFVESNYIKLLANQQGVYSQKGLTDCEGALRCVVRYNHIVNASCGDHGTEGGTIRGARASEWYFNYFDYLMNTTTVNIGTRSGNKLTHNNTINKTGVTSLGVIENFRSFSGGGAGQWRDADGQGPWDRTVNTVDTSAPSGAFPTLNIGHQSWVDGTSGAAPAAPYLFYSGTCAEDGSASSGNFGELRITVGGAAGPWTTPNMWKDYSVANLDFATNFTTGITTSGSAILDAPGQAPNAPIFTSGDIGAKIYGAINNSVIPAGTTIIGVNSTTQCVLSANALATVTSNLHFAIERGETRGGYIISSSDHGLTFGTYGGTDRGGFNKFHAGQRYEIHRILKALDTAGSGKGDLLVVSGAVSLNQAYSPPVSTWPRQLQEPTFTWNNKNIVTNAYLGFNSDPPYVHIGDNSSAVGLDLYNLGGGFGPTVTPQLVLDCFPAAVNGTLTPYIAPYQFPHRLVSGTVATVKLIQLVIASFPNTVVGSSSTQVLTITNVGNAAVTVSGVTYASVFTGATTGFSLPTPGSQQTIVVTFSPVAVVQYNSTISVAGDMDTSPVTVAVSGLGVAGGGGGPVAPSKLRFMLE